jgi:aminopeptidase N
VWTDEGIGWVAATVSELAAINATTASRLLNTFQHVRNMKPPLQERVKLALEEVLRQVPETVSPTIHRQARAYVNSDE